MENKPLQNIFEGKIIGDVEKKPVFFPGSDKPWENNNWQELLKQKPMDRVVFSPGELDERQTYLVPKLECFIAKAEKEIAASFENLIENYEKVIGEMPKEILEYLKEKNLMFPKFSLLVGNRAQKFLDSVDYNVDVEGKILMIFNLPKPLAKFWWKGDVEGSTAGVNSEVDGAGIEWGYFYHNIMPTVWENVGFLECESDVYIERLNGIGDHDPDSFYYIWMVSKPKNEGKGN